ncbi:MFS transporter [Hymenobacter jejuensis]|uniref:MFS transporter n=1 Tax=Hymenobacter jejuensis TaxID=2502781 RepID=A0A5B7ZXZ4_9BACT|nr:MFS transporter [Hymenobacter jejuensis]QDA59376.1 MFS transporter [Hymenobacter jejuensis]
MPFFRSSIYTAGFWLMCLSSFLFFASFNMLLPELPDFLTQLGGAEYKGFIIALFTLTAGFSRPFSGKLADTVGRIPVMVFGSLVCFLCGFFYPWVTTVAGFLLLRLLHGFSTGFKPTGTAAFVADIIPLERRGEAMGLLGVAGSLGMAAGPAVGSLITDHFSLNTMFYCSSGAALLSLAVQGTMTETLPLPQRERFSWRLLRLQWNEILEPQVLAPSLVTLLCMFSYGSILTVVPDHSELLRLGNKGLFFSFFTIASLVVRLVAGRASDRYGRVPVLRVSTAILVVALVTLALAQSGVVFLVAAVLFGLGSGLNSPTLYAWTIDLSEETRRGRAVATMYIALEAGIGIGALAAGWLYGNVPAHLSYVYGLSAAFALMALLYLLWGVRLQRKPSLS